MRQFSDLIVSNKDEYDRLLFMPEEVYDAASYRSDYGIGEGEKLLVYANTDKCYGALRGKGTIITDKAIYVDSLVRLNRDQKPLPLTELCDFLIYETKDSEVRLFAPEKEYRIFVSTKRSKDSTAGQLVSLLRTLQQSLIIDPEGKRAYHSTLKGVYEIIQREFSKSGVLSKDFLSILSVMEEFPAFRRQAVFLQLENEYRHLSPASYELLLSQKSNLLNEENIRVLNSPQDIFMESYLSDLRCPGSFLDVKAIIDSYLRLKALPKFSLNEAHILLYLCVRMEDYAYIDELLDEVGDELSGEELWEFFAFYCEHKTSQMSKIIVKLANGERLTPEELLYKSDLGFCSLHYALMLGNSQIIRRILPLCDWSKYRNPFEKDRISSCLFDPMFAASLILKDEEIIKEVFAYTSPQARVLRRSIRGMESMIDINLGLLNKYPESQKEYSEKLKEYKSLLSDMQEELLELSRQEVVRQKKLAEIIRDADHPLARHILEIFSSPVGIVSWHTPGVSEKLLCRYKQTFFFMPRGTNTELSSCGYGESGITESNVSGRDSYYKNLKEDRLSGNDKNEKLFDNPVARQAREEAARKARQQAEERRRIREEFMEKSQNPAPHGGSWFSQKAHEDIGALKEEYRILVKRYHPDSSRDASTAKILMRIMTERADILDYLRSKVG